MGDKKGDKRQEIEVKTCFAPLLRWILSWWPPDEKRIAIGLDATTLADRFTILCISVLYRGCAIPIAWKIIKGNQKGSWKPHWLALLNDLDNVIGSDWTVIALTDRGLYAKWLYEAIQKLQWHPFMRINQQGTYRPQGQGSFRPLKKCVPTKGTSWSGEATCFKTNPLKCTLLACWEEGYDHPWLIVTDLVPEQANVCWYGLRTWIECGFKDHKRGGWQWQYSKITDTTRAERFWLAIAVATLWVVSVGGEADANMPASGFDELPETHIARRLKKNRPSRARLLSCFRRGRSVILVALLRAESIPKATFLPEIWPNKLKQTALKTPKKSSSQELQLKAKKQPCPELA